jgi:hypothetical protein
MAAVFQPEYTILICMKKLTFKAVRVIGLMALAVLVLRAGAHTSEVLWLDFDMKSIPEPKSRDSSYYDYFFEGQMIEGAKQALDIPRWVRSAAGNPKHAANVNAVDEVPNSSWYTNRHHLRRMTEAELQRGPNKGEPPDFSSSVIIKAKADGVTPGMIIVDHRGTPYLIKFDPALYPNLQSGAEVISSKILYAAGYNVPQNYVAHIDLTHLKIANGVEIRDSKTGKMKPLTQDGIQEFLERVAKTPDGRCRVMASRILEGKPKGPFPQIGLRKDDPNDLIPHEHRRELRGLRVIASWINDWDLKEPQSLDMYVEEHGRKFLRHYLLDFGSSLGADDRPADDYHGRIYGLDPTDVLKEIFTLGLYESPTETRALILSPEIGNFTAVGFDPGRWKPTFRSVMFTNMTDLDAYWATRVVLSFTEADLRSIIQTGEYSRPETEEYILQTLMQRQQILARHWLGKVDGLAQFSLHRVAGGVALKFHDLMQDHNFVLPASSEYTYQVKGKRYESEKKTVTAPEVTIDREILAAAVEHARMDTSVEIRIWTRRGSSTYPPVSVYFDWRPDRDSFSIHRIVRG